MQQEPAPRDLPVHPVCFVFASSARMRTCIPPLPPPAGSSQLKAPKPLAFRRSCPPHILLYPYTQ